MDGMLHNSFSFVGHGLYEQYTYLIRSALFLHCPAFVSSHSHSVDTLFLPSFHPLGATSLAPSLYVIAASPLLYSILSPTVVNLILINGSIYSFPLSILVAFNSFSMSHPRCSSPGSNPINRFTDTFSPLNPARQLHLRERGPYQYSFKIRKRGK
jgi:hypothetical protein